MRATPTGTLLAFCGDRNAVSARLYLCNVSEVGEKVEVTYGCSMLCVEESPQWRTVGPSRQEETFVPRGQPRLLPKVRGRRLRRNTQLENPIQAGRLLTDRFAMGGHPFDRRFPESFIPSN